jgi:type II secretory ATPase GspE/PulE/Tfp pilus assembly ATPase PilB-like protein
MKEPGNLKLVDADNLSPEAAANRLIDQSVNVHASDLFLVSNEQHIAVQVRHLGIVRTLSILGVDQGRRVMAHIKALAGMDIAEKRRPTDGRWIYEHDDQAVDLRISVIPTHHGEDFAIRLLRRGTDQFQFENLGMTASQLAQFIAMIESPSGLILITGPTGSGKTATLYSALNRLHDGSRKINTIEDPIEFAVDGLRQSQVNPSIDVGFSELLRGVLRQSPDVIMLGEIRDSETALTAVQAANSGIVVFATIHAPTAAGAVQSMRALGVHSHFLSTSLLGVLSQRLVRTLCTQCRQDFDIRDARLFEDVRPWLEPNQGETFYAAKGCDHCNKSGYDGRTGVFEIMPVSRAIRSMISDGLPARDIRTKAIEEKMLPFRYAALLKVALGKTSTEEVFRVIPSEHLLQTD